MKSELDEKAVMMPILSNMTLKNVNKNLVDPNKMLFVHCTKTWAPVFDCLKDRQFTTTMYNKVKGALIWLHTRKLTTEGITGQAEREEVVELKKLDFTKAFFTSVMIFTSHTCFTKLCQDCYSEFHPNWTTNVESTDRNSYIFISRVRLSLN